MENGYSWKWEETKVLLIDGAGKSRDFAILPFSEDEFSDWISAFVRTGDIRSILEEAIFAFRGGRANYGMAVERLDGLLVEAEKIHELHIAKGAEIGRFFQGGQDLGAMLGPRAILRFATEAAKKIRPKVQ